MVDVSTTIEFAVEPVERDGFLFLRIAYKSAFVGQQPVEYGPIPRQYMEAAKQQLAVEESNRWRTVMGKELLPNPMTNAEVVTMAEACAIEATAMAQAAAAHNITLASPPPA